MKSVAPRPEEELLPLTFSDIPRLGPTRLLQGELTRDDEARLRVEGCRRLLVNEVNQEARKGLAFLERLPALEELLVSDLTIEDISGVAALHNLRRLSLNTHDKTFLDFKAFPHLRDCFTFWRPGIETLFGNTSLQRLHIQRYAEDDLMPLASLHRLEDLRLVDPRLKTLDGVDALPSLTGFAVVGARRLEDISALGRVTHVTDLELSQCPHITTIEPLAALSEVRSVVLNNCKRLESIKPLSKCSRLEELVMGGSTNVADGDLAFLTDLPRLTRALIQNRAHYRPSAKEVDDALASRA